MKFSTKIKSFKISSSSAKEAYISGNKQLAKYIASDKFKNITVEVKKIDEFTVEFTLYSTLDLAKEQKDFCTVCKEFHSNFYVNEEYNCNKCAMKSFLRKIQVKLNTSRNFYRARID